MKAHLLKKILLVFIIASTLSLYAGKNNTVAEVYRNPKKSIGSGVSWYGTIIRIDRAGLPMTILLLTKGQLWYVKFFDIKKIEKDLIRKGSEILVEGKYLGMKGIMFRGSSLEIPLIYCSRISRKW